MNLSPERVLRRGMLDLHLSLADQRYPSLKDQLFAIFCCPGLPRLPFDVQAYDRLQELTLDRDPEKLQQFFGIPKINESTHDLTIGVSTLNRTSSVVGKPTTSQSLFYRDKFEQIPPEIELGEDLANKPPRLRQRIRRFLEDTIISVTGRPDTDLVREFRETLVGNVEAKKYIDPFVPRPGTVGAMRKFASEGGKLSIVSYTPDTLQPQIVEWARVYNLLPFLADDFPIITRSTNIPNGLWHEKEVGSISQKFLAQEFFTLHDGIRPFIFDDAIEVGEIYSFVFGGNSYNPFTRFYAERMRQLPFPADLKRKIIQNNGVIKTNHDLRRTVLAELNN